MAGSPKTAWLLACFVLAVAAGCSDSGPSSVLVDAGPADAGADAAPSSLATCCADESCSRVEPGACRPGELCVLDDSGKNGMCAAACPEEQACGSLCCPWGASCEQGRCVLTDLSVEVAPSRWPYPNSLAVGEESCLAQDRCLPRAGRYTLLETGVRVKNAGKATFRLPASAAHAQLDVSFCQGSYLMRDFVHAKIKDVKGKVVRESDLPTLCTAEGDDYLCAVSGLTPGSTVDLPRGACNQLDVTGLERGDYRVELTVNPNGVVAETRHDNNVASYTFSHTGCDGFVCGGECCPADVVCVDGACKKPNLVINKEVLRKSLVVTGRDVTGDMCTQEDRCTLALGQRRLLAFETRIENVGAGDFDIGNIEGNPFVELGCFSEPRIENIVRYRLLDANNRVAVEAHERNLCIEDMESAGRTDPDHPSTSPWGSSCGHLSTGYATSYGSGQSCQWMDVTGLSAGKYRLEVIVNPERIASEESYADNLVRADVDLPAVASCAAKEVCGDAIDQDCDQLSDDWDDDCGGVGPGPGPDPQGYTPTTGNTSCATAHAVSNDLRLSTLLSPATSSELCGAKGASAFYAVTVASDEIVYVDALDSGAGTSLIVHAEACSDTPLDCSERACGRESGLLARTLTPGKYIIEARTHQANVQNTARVRIERTQAAGVSLVREAGIVAGDTSTHGTAEVGLCSVWNPETSASEHVPFPGPHDSYAVAHCASDFVASTCGSAAFASAGLVYDRAGNDALTCSFDSNGCKSDAQGFTVFAYFDEPGLDFVAVGGQSEGAKGEYQLQLSF